MKKKWIWEIRGLAIIGVVVCHQQGILHNTEIIQLLSLYSVSTLIFLMGVTKVFSLCKAKEGSTILAYTMHSVLPVLLSYIVATFFYGYIIEGSKNYNDLLIRVLNFSGSGPFYFIEYYILLSLWAPLLYVIIRKILLTSNLALRYLKMITFFIIIWCIGYASIGKLDIFGQSYMFLYCLGILVGCTGIPGERKFFIPASGILLLGLWETWKFYCARIAGNYSYAEGTNVLSPKLQMNPPGVPIIIYAVGVIWISYLIFERLNKLTKNVLCEILSNLGKYSMDIFLWHLLIQYILNKKLISMEMGIIKSLIYYSAMFGIPILGRSLYTRIKSSIYEILIEKTQV